MHWLLSKLFDQSTTGIVTVTIKIMAIIIKTLTGVIENKLIIGGQASCILALALGYWGRGNTLEDATARLKEQGAKVKSQKVIYFLIVGDADAIVDRRGNIVSEVNSATVQLGTNGVNK